MNVAFLTEETIEAESEAILAAYWRQQGPGLKPPIPVEDILEIHLGLSLNLDDLRSVLGVEDVIGALWIDKHEVFIDQSLDPTHSPELKGRFNFTIAHEIGHWRLHRQYFIKDQSQTTLWPDTADAPSVVCRTSRSKDRIEWQADRLAASLLMPRQMLLQAWRERFGHTGAQGSGGAQLARLSRKIAGMSYNGLLTIELNNIALPFSLLFDVSKEAMRIRLETLGLLVREAQPADMFT